MSIQHSLHKTQAWNPKSVPSCLKLRTTYLCWLCEKGTIVRQWAKIHLHWKLSQEKKAPNRNKAQSEAREHFFVSSNEGESVSDDDDDWKLKIEVDKTNSSCIFFQSRQIVVISKTNRNLDIAMVLQLTFFTISDFGWPLLR